MLCRKCVLPERKPDIWLNEEGVCNICIDFERQEPSLRATVILESELIKILEKHRGRNRYDCLVMCSGGKDSALSLYYMKKKYRMNTLAFTFDHGFENDEAIINVRNVVDILGVDWLYFKSDFMKDIFKRVITTKTAAPICHICAIWYIQLTYDIAARYNIPIIVGGWTKGQSTERQEIGKEYCAMSCATADFISRYLHTNSAYKKFPLSIKEVIKMSQKKAKIIAISPHWFLQYDPYRIMEILQKELKWKAPSLSYPKNSTNCIMNFVSVYLSMIHYGYTHYHIEMSKLIRLGELSREEALNLLEINFDHNLVNSVLSKIGCRLES